MAARAAICCTMLWRCPRPELKLDMRIILAAAWLITTSVVMYFIVEFAHSQGGTSPVEGFLALPGVEKVAAAGATIRSNATPATLRQQATNVLTVSVSLAAATNNPSLIAEGLRLVAVTAALQQAADAGERNTRDL